MDFYAHSNWVDLGMSFALNIFSVSATCIYEKYRFNSVAMRCIGKASIVAVINFFHENSFCFRLCNHNLLL